MFVGVEIKSVSDLVHIRRDVDRKKPYEHKHTDTIWAIEPLDDYQRRCVYIMGATGCGKTQWALHQFVSPLLVRHMDKLNEFDPEIHDGIVFDDMSFAHLPRETAIYLTDWDEDSDIHVRYKCAFIPAHTRKIFTSNKPFHENWPVDEFGAIRRRFTRIIHAHGKLYRQQGADLQLEGVAATTEGETAPGGLGVGDDIGRAMLINVGPQEHPGCVEVATNLESALSQRSGGSEGSLDDLRSDDLISQMCDEFLLSDSN